MKIKMETKYKRYVIVATVLITLVLIMLFINTYNSQVIVQEEQTVYSYSCNNTAKYSVRLRDNNLYESQVMEEGRTYLTTLVEGIEVEFVSEFRGDSVTSIEGEYEIQAEVRGYTDKVDQKEVVWSKVYPIQDKQTFKQDTDYVENRSEIELNFKGYKQFADSVVETTNVRIPTELLVTFSGKVVTQYEENMIEEPILSTLSIPLNKEYFTIQKKEQKQENSIKKQVEHILPPDQKRLLFLGGGSVCGMVVLAIMIWGTQPLNEEELRRKQIRQIIRLHGSRLVAIDRVVDQAHKEIHQITDIEDLIKLADELEKPVFYIKDKDLININRFYIVDQEIVYMYKLQAQSVQLLVQENEKEMDDEVFREKYDDDRNSDVTDTRCGRDLHKIQTSKDV